MGHLYLKRWIQVWHKWDTHWCSESWASSATCSHAGWDGSRLSDSSAESAAPCCRPATLSPQRSWSEEDAKMGSYTSFSCNFSCLRENLRGRPDSTTLLTGWWTSIRSTLQHNSAGHVRLNNEISAQKRWEVRLIPRDGDGYISSWHVKKQKRCKL